MNNRKSFTDEFKREAVRLAKERGNVTATARDRYGNVATGYTGTAHFTSTDKTATLPLDYIFTGADHGMHTFTGIVARKSGTQTITARDLLFSSIMGSDVFNLP